MLSAMDPAWKDPIIGPQYAFLKPRVQRIPAGAGDFERDRATSLLLGNDASWMDRTSDCDVAQAKLYKSLPRSLLSKPKPKGQHRECDWTSVDEYECFKSLLV